MILYNRYIPKGNTYERVVVDDTPLPPHPSSPPFPPPPAPGPKPPPNKAPEPSLLSGLFGGSSPLKGLSSLFGSGDSAGGGGLGSLLKQFKLDSLDTGDILLVLIILFLFLEGDNLEVVITLGLLLLMGL
jgi:hypothetical protein